MSQLPYFFFFIWEDDIIFLWSGFLFKNLLLPSFLLMEECSLLWLYTVKVEYLYCIWYYAIFSIWLFNNNIIIAQLNVDLQSHLQSIPIILIKNFNQSKFKNILNINIYDVFMPYLHPFLQPFLLFFQIFNEIIFLAINYSISSFVLIFIVVSFTIYLLDLRLWSEYASCYNCSSTWKILALFY